ncbi:MAG: hypothetical protein ACYDCS_14410 [Candidatus Dormibacteria bacterium]
MPKVVMTHAVVDVERWLKGKAERAGALSPYATNVTDYAAADGSNNIAVTADIQDLAAAQAMLASPPPETAALMETHGVLPPITTYIER